MGVHSENWMLFSDKKKWVTKSWEGHDEPYLHTAKWNKPFWKGYMPYNSNCVTFWKGKTIETKKYQWFPGHVVVVGDEWVEYRDF